nr:protein sidekick-2-like [Lytechinus pictus]
MAHSVWITCICLCALISVSGAITATVLEDFAILHRGDNHTIHCIIDIASTNLTAADVVWIKDYDKAIDHHPHSVLNDTVARLHIQEALFDDKGTYYCSFPGDSFFDFLEASATVHVGLPPEPVENLNCYTTNINEYWCEWEDGRPTNLKTVDTLYYQGPYVNGNREILPCHPERENNFCRVIDDPFQTEIFVVSENPLGNSTSHLNRQFDPHSEVRPNPPGNVRAEITERRKIAMSWEQPSDWHRTGLAYGLHYWLQYRKEGEGWQNVSLDSIRTDTEYIISALDPYTTYFVRVSCAYDVLVDHYDGNPFGTWSEPIEVVTMAEEPGATMRPLTVVNVNGDANSYTRDVVVGWQAIPVTEYRGPNFGYNVSVHDETGGVVKYKLTTNDLFHLKDLDRFRRLTVYVTPYNDVGPGVNRGQTTLQDETTVPDKPEDLRVVTKTASSLQVSWEPPSRITGHVLRYELEWFKTSDHSGMMSADVPPTESSHEIANLEAYTSYRVSVKTVNKRGPSSGAALFVMTSQSGPSGSPQALRVSPVPTNPDQLLLSWEEVPVNQRNGEIQFYTIIFCPLDPAQEQDSPITVSLATGSHCADGTQQELNVTGSPLPLSETISGLKPFTEYVVRIAASTSAARGPPSSLKKAKTSQGMPSPPRDLLLTFSNDSVIQLVWEAPEQMNGVFKNYIIKYNDEVQSLDVKSATLAVNGYVNYTIDVQACSNADPSLACSLPATTRVMTDIGAPLMVTNVDVHLETQDTVIVNWGRPVVPNGPIDYYMVRYRPADSDVEWMETEPLLTPSATIQIDCDLVDGATFFNFEVFAVNEVDSIPLAGTMSLAHHFEVCNLHKVPVVTIVLAILLPSFVVFIAFCFLIWVKQSDLFKPAPDPYFIEAVLDHNDEKFQLQGRLLSVRTEGEKFDTLRQASSTTNLLQLPYERSSSKESTSTNSSTDQGIHDMDGFTDELRYVQENTGSRSNSESDEDKASAPAKHVMRIMSDDYEEEDTVFGADCDGSVTYSRIAEVDGADCSTPMLSKEAAAQYMSDGSEGYSQLSQVPLQASATPPAPIRGLADQRSEASFGSQSTVSYHRLGMSGLTPITSVETLPSEDPLAYARLSQGSETDNDYSQLASDSSNQSPTESRGERTPRQTEPRNETNNQESKGLAMSLPSVSMGGRIQPPQEFIVATALSPGNHPNPVSKTDLSGYVTSPPVTKPPPPVKHVSPDMPKKDLKCDHKNLADSKSQSGSDSSLTDGEAYSTLGLAESPSSSVPHHRPQKVDASFTKPDPHVPVDSGYVSKEAVTPADLQNTPVKNPSGYITEAELQSLPQKQPSLADPKSDHKNDLPESISSPNKHIPNGLPKVRANGYIAHQDVLPLQKTDGPKTTNHNAADPYITPEQMAQMPQGSQHPPSTPSPPPSPPLNNNHPLPPGKEFRPDDPCIGIGVDRNIAALPANHSSNFAVC